MNNLLSNNQHLSNMLQNKIAQTPLSLDHNSRSDTGFRTEMTMAIDPSIETQLQADGFHFTELPEGSIMDFMETNTYDASPASIFPATWKQQVEPTEYCGFISGSPHDQNRDTYSHISHGSVYGSSASSSHLANSNTDQLI